MKRLRSRNRLAPLALLALIAVLLAACSAATSAPGGVERMGYRGAGTTDAKPAIGAPAPGGVANAEPAMKGNDIPIAQVFDPARSLILTATVAMRASDPWAISDRAQQIATALGGDVMGLNQSGTKDDRTANLVLRVPADRFNEALRQLRGLDAEVVSSGIDGKDVTDQFVDLKARLAAKQSEEQRYLALLTRADKVDDILKIDQALGAVRTQIEQLTGQINSIASRTKFSTISVSITPLVPIVPPDPRPAWDPGRTIAAALAALALIFRGVADLAIWLLVFGWIPLIVLGGIAIATRARRAATGPAA